MPADETGPVKVTHFESISIIEGGERWGSTVSPTEDASLPRVGNGIPIGEDPHFQEREELLNSLDWDSIIGLLGALFDEDQFGDVFGGEGRGTFVEGRLEIIAAAILSEVQASGWLKKRDHAQWQREKSRCTEMSFLVFKAWAEEWDEKHPNQPPSLMDIFYGGRTKGFNEAEGIE